MNEDDDRAADECWLYVCTPGFGCDFEVEAQRACELVTLLDRDDFTQLLLGRYEDLDVEYKAQIPLRKVWVPAEWGRS